VNLQSLIKQYGIWMLLAITLSATAWISFTEDKAGDVLIVKRPPTNSRAPAPPIAITDEFNMDTLLRPKTDELPSNLFNTDMPVAVQTQEAISIPLQEQVPTIPYTYAGKLEEDGHYIVFLTKNGRNYVVREGDALGKWQIKTIRPPQMILSYKPLQAEVPMSIGEVN